MPCFDINTRLGIAMVDTLGGAVRVNNLLPALDLKVINPNNLKSMEGRAGEVIKAFANNSTQKAEKTHIRKKCWTLLSKKPRSPSKFSRMLVELKTWVYGCFLMHPRL